MTTCHWRQPHEREPDQRNPDGCGWRTLHKFASSADAVRAHVPVAGPRVGVPRIFDRVHDRASHNAITAELVACTLGQRQRPELLTRET